MRRKYKNPPINEVVIGVYFKDAKRRAHWRPHPAVHS